MQPEIYATYQFSELIDGNSEYHVKQQNGYDNKEGEVVADARRESSDVGDVRPVTQTVRHEISDAGATQKTIIKKRPKAECKRIAAVHL